MRACARTRAPTHVSPPYPTPPLTPAAPAALDEDGKEINPHIPQYMTSAPWYLNTDKPTLKHQRNWNAKEQDDMRWYDRGAKVFQATKWRKGACEK